MRYLLLIAIMPLLIWGCSPSKKAVGKKSVFSGVQEQLIGSGLANEPMRVFKITQREDSLLLRTPSETVRFEPGDSTLQLLIDRMYATVTDSMSLGVGIAAPQVGILKKLILVQRLDKENFPFEAYINPEIKEYSEKKRPCREGCLSIPGRRDTTFTRSYEILVEYDRIDGTHHKERVEDFVSVIFQHEIDHLDGILYLDHLIEESKPD